MIDGDVQLCAVAGKVNTVNCEGGRDLHAYKRLSIFFLRLANFSVTTPGLLFRVLLSDC